MLSNSTINHVDYTKRIEELETEIVNIKLILSKVLTVKSFTFEATFKEWVYDNSITTFQPIDINNEVNNKVVIGLYNTIEGKILETINDEIYLNILNSPTAYLEIQTKAGDITERLICQKINTRIYNEHYQIIFSIILAGYSTGSSRRYFNFVRFSDNSYSIVYNCIQYDNLLIDSVIAGNTFTITIKYT